MPRTKKQKLLRNLRPVVKGKKKLASGFATFESPNPDDGYYIDLGALAKILGQGIFFVPSKLSFTVRQEIHYLALSFLNYRRKYWMLVAETRARPFYDPHTRLELNEEFDLDVETEKEISELKEHYKPRDERAFDRTLGDFEYKRGSLRRVENYDAPAFEVAEKGELADLDEVIISRRNKDAAAERRTLDQIVEQKKVARKKLKKFKETEE